MGSENNVAAIKSRGAARATGGDSLPAEGWVRCYRGVLQNPDSSEEDRIEASAGIAAYKARVRARGNFKQWLKENEQKVAEILASEAVVKSE